MLFVFFTGCSNTKSTDSNNKGTTIDLNNIGLKEVTVKVGDQLTYSFEVHGSVGYSGAYKIDHEEVVMFADEKIKYHHPERMKEGMTGGDAATGTYVFKAKAPGTATITVDQLFRGEVEASSAFNITVQ